MLKREPRKKNGLNPRPQKGAVKREWGGLGMAAFFLIFQFEMD
jgi:hypothetical protein